MLEVDPQALTATQWSEVTSILFYLWAFMIAIGGFAFNFLIAHAVIPSLVTTRHLPSRFQRARFLFYLFALLAAGGVAWSLANFVLASEVLRTLYPKVWI